MKVIKEDYVPSGTGRFYLLDLLRFFAALAVVFYHYSVYFNKSDFFGLIHFSYFGYLGVPFFFILSGFVITASALNRTPLQFALSRVVRLYPAFWGGLLFAVCLNLALGDSVFTLKEILLNATILNDYFGIKNIDDVYWTLQAELKFYGCVFLLLAFNIFKNFSCWILSWLFLAIIHYFTSEPSILGAFISPSYSFYFIGGVCCYLLHLKKGDVRLLLILAVTILFSMLIAFNQVKSFYPTASEFDHYIVIFIVAIFYLLFYLISIGKLATSQLFGFKFLGAISYPLYLVHNFSGKLIIEKLLLYCSPFLAVGVALIIVLLVSSFIYMVIEKTLSPMINRQGGKLINLLSPSRLVNN